MITDIMVGFEAAAEIVPLGSQSLAGEVWDAGEPLKLQIETDYSFRMPVDGKFRTYHVEADRAKEPAYRKNIKTQRSIYQKLLVYKESWSPQNRFQVLIVTTTERKARRLAEMANIRIDWRGCPRNLVQFGWPHDNPLNALWYNRNGEQVKMTGEQTWQDGTAPLDPSMADKTEKSKKAQNSTGNLSALWHGLTGRSKK
jgi:hypothetical protein